MTPVCAATTMQRHASVVEPDFPICITFTLQICLNDRNSSLF
jgi:hypothetical protein